MPVDASTANLTTEVKAAATAPPVEDPTTTAKPAAKPAAAKPANGAKSTSATEPSAATAVPDPVADVPSAVFAVLANEPYVCLTTFRKVGTPVPTPVWSAPEGDVLLVWTGADSGKVKRLRHTPGVTVAPCDRQGRLLGDPVPATARVMEPAEMTRVKAAMIEKYGWQFRMSALGATIGQFLRIAPHGQIGIEITLD
jgi:PPOX class probable F420-dependent enzyme